MEIQLIDEMIESLKLNELIELESIPNIDLYMDQVITLFEEKLAHTKRNENDKLLTKTMINNYAKDKLLMPAKKKKYTKEHIILMILLYEMKQILTIADIKEIFGTIIKDGEVDSKKLNKIYKIYLKMKIIGLDAFENQVNTIHSDLKEEIRILSQEEGKIEDEITQDMLMAILLTQKANYYKRLAEKIIDEKISIINKGNSKK
ncbi:DUF1836 domain-containing protein [Cellulosilyticum ruminicola]|uniref:DUF1836 domain-containing protein n=1 Tax=Cellulosilyticum ruminicola TaxID=425254 RepID=UPI0006D0C163|nr:DUF1836 domain-containing protein [Cellulosilyticum ruminicola]